MYDVATIGGRVLFIGIDGGGTGCRARIEDAQGRALGTGKAGPAAVRLGIKRSLAAVEVASRAAVTNAGLPPETLSDLHAGVGLAGAERKGALLHLKARRHPFRSVTYASDAMIACIGAHGGQDGGIVILGTGSVGFAIIGKRKVRVGGYGFPISDEGSGADLGLRALRASLRAWDGRIPETDLTREVMARFDDDPYEVVAWTETATATEYASLAPLVMRHAMGQDPVARQIVAHAAAHIDQLVRRLTEEGAPRIALLGGLAPMLEPWLTPETRRWLVPIEGDAISGALHLARSAVKAEVQ